MTRRARISRVLVPLAVMLAVLAGCQPDAGDVDTSRPSEFGFQKPVKTSLIDEGREAYATYCVGCHGEEGDGNGPAARFMRPRPRNFQTARFRFSSTRAGRLPTDDDLRRTIREGLKGSAMPPWDMLDRRTIDALIVYLKTFAPAWEEESPAPPIPRVDDPYRGREDKTAAIERGRAVYHGFATCWTCHPSYVSTDEINDYLAQMENPTRDAFRDNLFQAEPKVNAEGEQVFPPDFRRDFLRAGANIDDLYRSIAAGITGTAMPTWVDSMQIPSSENPDRMLVTPGDLWAMAYYVQSLVLERPRLLDPETVVVRDRKQEILLDGTPPKAEPAPEAEPEPFFEEEEEFFEEEFFEEPAAPGTNEDGQ